MKKRKSCKKLAAVSAAALLLTGTLTVEHASAYFTTYVSAGGSQVVRLGSKTEIHEDVSDMTKHISIQNTSQIYDCFVRVKVFYGGGLKISYQDKSESGNLWSYSQNDGYWYYKPILSAGESTELFDIQIGDLPEDFDKESFNVVVIQDRTPVVYDDHGNPSADSNTVYKAYQKIADRSGEGAGAK